MSQPGFFDLDERYESLSKCGDPLEVLAKEIPWESFRYPLKKALRKPKKSKAGRKAFDPVLMFKVLVLQNLYNLSDQQTEFMIRDRLVEDAAWGWDWATGCRTKKPSGSLRTLWRQRKSPRSSLPASTSISSRRGLPPKRARSWTPPSWRCPSSATPARRTRP